MSEVLNRQMFLQGLQSNSDALNPNILDINPSIPVPPPLSMGQRRKLIRAGNYELLKPNEIYDSKTDQLYTADDDFVNNLTLKGFNLYTIMGDDTLIKGKLVKNQLDKFRKFDEPFYDVNPSRIGLTEPRDLGTGVIDMGLGALRFLEPYARTLTGTLGELTGNLGGTLDLKSADDDVKLGISGLRMKDDTGLIPSREDRARYSLSKIASPASDIEINQRALADAKARGFVPPETSIDDAKLPASFDRDEDTVINRILKLIDPNALTSDLDKLEEDKPVGFLEEYNRKQAEKAKKEGTTPEEPSVDEPGKLDGDGKEVLTGGDEERVGGKALADVMNQATEFTSGSPTPSPTPAPTPAPTGGTTETITTKSTTPTTLPKEGMDMGASLADIFQKISAVPNVKNTLDLLQGGAQTLSALNLAEEAKEKADTRAYQTAIAKEIAKAKADLNKPLSLREKNTLTDRSLEVDQAVTDFKNTSQNLALIDRLIELTNDPEIKGWRGFVGKLTTQVDAFLAAANETPESFDKLPPRVQFEKLMTVVSQKNIKDILNETGKTISNIDRDIVDRIMGKITVFTNPAETLKSLQLAREDSLKNLESYRNKGRTLLGLLKEYDKVPGSAQTETDVLEQLINFDRKTYRSNLTNENFTSGAGVSYAGAPVYNLSGQKISD
jgi:hypothetical protein